MIEAKNIESLNSAIYVVRHFVEMSVKLLPIYEKLTRTNTELKYVDLKSDIKKIEKIYLGGKMNPQMGRFLLGSDIIARINRLFIQMKDRTDTDEEKIKQEMEAFQEEYNRLTEQWYKVWMN